MASVLCRDFVIDKVTVEAAKNRDIHAEKGEYISIYCLSSAGNSTILNLVGTLDRSSSGKKVAWPVDKHKIKGKTVELPGK